MPTTDQHLDEVTIAQMTWKPGPSAQVAVAIAMHAEKSINLIWSDEVHMPSLAAEDRNCIGPAWRWLAKLGMITRLEGMGDHRRSTRPESRGRVVWRYQITSPGLIRAFLKRHGHHAAPKQQQLL